MAQGIAERSRRRTRDDADDELAVLSRPRSSRPTRTSICGLIARTTTSALATAVALSSTVLMPYLLTSSFRRSARGWLATIWSAVTCSPRSSPAIIASAMTPDPTVAMRLPLSDMRRSLNGRRGSTQDEEARSLLHFYRDEAGYGECGLQFCGCPVDLGNREFATVVEAAF